MEELKNNKEVTFSMEKAREIGDKWVKTCYSVKKYSIYSLVSEHQYVSFVGEVQINRYRTEKIGIKVEKKTINECSVEELAKYLSFRTKVMIKKLEEMNKKKIAEHFDRLLKKMDEPKNKKNNVSKPKHYTKKKTNKNKNQDTGKWKVNYHE